MKMFVHEGEDEYVTRTAVDPDTGLRRIQQTRLNGRLHAPPWGEPSEIVFDDKGQPLELRWHAHNLEHREDGPSSVHLFEGTNRTSLERFCLEGQPRDRHLGPSKVFLNKDGEVIEEVFARQKDRFPQATIDHMRDRLEP